MHHENVSIVKIGVFYVFYSFVKYPVEMSNTLMGDRLLKLNGYWMYLGFRRNLSENFKKFG